MSDFALRGPSHSHFHEHDAKQMGLKKQFQQHHFSKIDSGEAHAKKGVKASKAAAHDTPAQAVAKKVSRFQNIISRIALSKPVVAIRKWYAGLQLRDVKLNRGNRYLPGVRLEKAEEMQFRVAIDKVKLEISLLESSEKRLKFEMQKVDELISAYGKGRVPEAVAELKTKLTQNLQLLAQKKTSLESLVQERSKDAADSLKKFNATMDVYASNPRSVLVHYANRLDEHNEKIQGLVRKTELEIASAGREGIVLPPSSPFISRTALWNPADPEAIKEIKEINKTYTSEQKKVEASTIQSRRTNKVSLPEFTTTVKNVSIEQYQDAFNKRETERAKTKNDPEFQKLVRSLVRQKDRSLQGPAFESAVQSELSHYREGVKYAVVSYRPSTDLGEETAGYQRVVDGYDGMSLVSQGTMLVECNDDYLRTAFEDEITNLQGVGRIQEGQVLNVAVLTGVSEAKKAKGPQEILSELRTEIEGQYSALIRSYAQQVETLATEELPGEKGNTFHALSTSLHASVDRMAADIKKAQGKAKHELGLQAVKERAEAVEAADRKSHNIADMHAEYKAQMHALSYQFERLEHVMAQGTPTGMKSKEWNRLQEEVAAAKGILDGMKQGNVENLGRSITLWNQFCRNSKELKKAMRGMGVAISDFKISSFKTGILGEIRYRSKAAEKQAEAAYANISQGLQKAAAAVAQKLANRPDVQPVSLEVITAVDRLRNINEAEKSEKILQGLISDSDSARKDAIGTLVRTGVLSLHDDIAEAKIPGLGEKLLRSGFLGIHSDYKSLEKAVSADPKKAAAVVQHMLKVLEKGKFSDAEKAAIEVLKGRLQVLEKLASIYGDAKKSLEFVHGFALGVNAAFSSIENEGLSGFVYGIMSLKDEAAQLSREIADLAACVGPRSQKAVAQARQFLRDVPVKVMLAASRDENVKAELFAESGMGNAEWLSTKEAVVAFRDAFDLEMKERFDKKMLNFEKFFTSFGVNEGLREINKAKSVPGHVHTVEVFMRAAQAEKAELDGLVAGYSRAEFAQKLLKKRESYLNQLFREAQGRLAYIVNHIKDEANRAEMLELNQRYLFERMGVITDVIHQELVQLAAVNAQKKREHLTEQTQAAPA